jgi:hypothetical protein
MAEPPPPDLATIRTAISPAAQGPTTFRIAMTEEEGKTVALIHVFGAYDCKGTEAEVAGLLEKLPIKLRFIWH